MSKQAFFDAIYQAFRDARNGAPLVNGKHDREAIERHLGATNTWFTPTITESYQADDFADLPADTRAQLEHAVNQFRACVVAGQRDAAWPHFLTLLHFAQQQELAAWRTTIESLYRQSEEWAAKHEWATKRYPKQMHDSYFGHFKMPQLLIHRLDGRFVLDPIARYVGGANGLVDLYIMPSWDSTRVIQRQDSWYIVPADNDNEPQPWSEKTLSETLDGLAQSAV